MLVSIWNEGGAYLSLWRSVFVRLAWDRIATVEKMTGEPVGQGSSVRNPSQELLEVLTQAYSDAAETGEPWNTETSTSPLARTTTLRQGGGSALRVRQCRRGEKWYTRSLQQLKPSGTGSSSTSRKGTASVVMWASAK